MLIEFAVTNFQCFRDEATLSLVPARQDSRLRGNIWTGNRYSALKSAAIFGPNASGKTSLLHALYVLRDFVSRSTSGMTIGDPIAGVSPFRLSSVTHKGPSRFQVLVELDGVGFRYRVEATRERVHRERLERQDAATRSNWVALIERDERDPHQSKIVLHERLGAQARREQIIEDTRNNALVLSRAAERNVEVVLPIFRWFKQGMCHSAAATDSPPDLWLLQSFAGTAKKDQHYLTRLAELVRDADTGIVALGTEAVAFDPFSLSELKMQEGAPPELRKAATHIREAVRVLAELSEEEERVAPSPFRFYTEHEGSEGDRVRFDLTDESAGTLRYLLIVGRLLGHCQRGDLIVIDELDSSLHPQLARRIVQFAHSPEFSPSGTQLLFSAQDVTLMDPTLLRRDQVFLTQKNSDGASELYSLWDFEQMPRNNAAWARNYLAGRFGGVPVFGPLLADVPQPDEPTRVQVSDPHSAEIE